MMDLDVKPYDPIMDVIEIEGTRYSGQFFRELGCNFLSMVGQVLRIDKKENGIITVTRLKEKEENGFSDNQSRPGE